MASRSAVSGAAKMIASKPRCAAAVRPGREIEQPDDLDRYPDAVEHAINERALRALRLPREYVRDCRR
jgi:hypothetical protein